MSARGSRLLRPEYREAFERDLRRLHARSGPWNLVVISGDLTVTGSKREFELLDSTLESLWKFIRSLGSHPALLAVPGDHDFVPRGLSSNSGDPSAAEVPAHERLRNFTEWFGAWRRTHFAGMLFDAGQVPGDFAATLGNEGMQIGVLGLNTVERSSPEGSHRMVQFDVAGAEESLGQDLQKWSFRHDGVLLLTHSPWAVMGIGAIDRLQAKITPAGRPFLHLCGNWHQKEWTEPLQRIPRLRAVQCPSLLSERRTTPGRWGYVAGQWITSSGLERMRLFPRTVSVSESGVTIGPIPQVGDDEAHSIPLDMLRSRAEAESAPRSPPAARTPTPASSEPAPRPPTPAEKGFRVLRKAPASGSLPPGMRLQLTLSTGNQLIRSLAWAPSGDALALGSAFGVLSYWRTGEAEPRWSVSTPSVIGDLDFSRDGQLLASCSRQSMRVWTKDGAPMQTTRFPGSVVAWSSTGLLATDSGTGILWVRRREHLSHDEEKPAHVEVAVVNCLAWSPDGRILIRGGEKGETNLKAWSVESGATVRLVPMEVGQKPRCAILDAAWMPSSSWVALAGSDKNIHIWDPHSGGALVAVLEGHTDIITSISFSFDGRLLASRTAVGTILLWRTDTWEQVDRIDEPTPQYSRAGVAFSPTQHVLAMVAHGSTEVWLWEVSPEALLQGQKPSATVHELSAKVVLVGEGRSGKSCLALRLAQDRYEEMESTHGMRFWSLPVEPASTGSDQAGTRREVILWDMGGQSEYQLVHQLFLRDSTVALMVLEPGRGDRALDEVEGWNQRLLAQSGRRTIRKILVGTKVDSAMSPVDLPAIQGLVKRCQLGAYVPTSAKTGQGISELKAALARAIDWGSIEKISRPELFQRLRQQIQRLREARRVVLTFLDLESELRREMGTAFDPEMLQTVVEQLARQGLVADSRMADGTRVLVLEVEQVERYAGSLIVAARDNPHGVPALDIAKVMSPSMQFPRIPPEERLLRDQELQVVDCVIALLLEHGLCMRHEGLLIFPSLFRPTQAEAVGEEFSHAVSLHYDFSGPIDNIYASLITSLAISKRFGSMRLWQDRAEFGRAGEESSGLRRVRQGNQAARGHARLEVYFDSETPEATRELFVNFIEEHLAERGVELLEQLAVKCVCGRTFPEDNVRDRLQRGGTFIQCPVCDHQTPLTLGAQQARERNPALVEQLHALKTDIRERRSGEIIDVKIGAGMTKLEALGANTPLRILHLSDLHIGAEDDPDSLFQPLEADLADQKEGLGQERLDYLVISGDITHRASPQEFEKAHAFVSKLIERFELTAERCILVPGNHDLDWETEVYTWKRKRHVKQEQLKPGSFIEAGDGYNLRDDARYPERFKNFSQHFYHPLTQKRYPLAPEEQCLPVLFSEDRLQFLAVNSAWEIDEYFQDRASISEQALSRGLAIAEQQRREALKPGIGALRIGVWHHPITGNAKIHDTAFVERLLQADVHVCLHGHVHEERADLVNYLHSRRMHVVGAGSFGAPMHHRPESVPRLFNLLEIQRDLRRLKVHTRCLRRQGGAWEGWAVWPWPGGERGAKRSFYELDLP